MRFRLALASLLLVATLALAPAAGADLVAEPHPCSGEVDYNCMHYHHSYYLNLDTGEFYASLLPIFCGSYIGLGEKHHGSPCHHI